MARTVLSLPPRRAVVELGALDINGGVRNLFTGARIIGVDLVDGEGVDEVADAALYMPPFTPDTVVCCEVLEHAENARAIVENAYKMLGPGGVFLMTCAGPGRAEHSAVDGAELHEAEFYRNVGEHEARSWFEPFRTIEIEIDERAGDLRVLAWKATADEYAGAMR